MAHASFNPDNFPNWISKLTATKPSNVIAGVNDDDCAVVKWKSPLLVATTDFINANPIVIELGIGGLREVGRLVVAANLSDLCGSGANPVGILVGITLPYTSTETEFKTLMRSIHREATRHNVTILGGDTKLGPARTVIITAIGESQHQSKLFLKNKAKEGDSIWVSGPLGSAAASAWGYKNKDLSSRWKRWARKSLTIPKLPLKQSALVAKHCFGNGGTDISDGLGADLAELCHSSKVGCVIDATSIPLCQEVRLAARVAGVEPWRFAFASGGDFQFIVTTRPAHSQQMTEWGFTKIGSITKTRKLTIKCKNEILPLPTKGHEDSRLMTFAEETDSLIRD